MDRGAADNIGTVGHLDFAAFFDRRDVPKRMNMRVDAARNDDLAGGVDHPHRLDVVKNAGCGDGDEGFTRDADVPGAAALRCDHLVSANYQI